MANYPHCKRLGILRTAKNGMQIISTAALYAAVGPKAYREALPHLRYEYGGKRHGVTMGPLAGPIEEWLKSLDQAG
jgi:hypothetical protein